MNKALVFVGILAALIILGFVFRGPIMFTLGMAYISPDMGFDEDDHPAPPDYANPAHWAALPDREDGADLTPKGAEDLNQQADAAVDVFFVHPTTYFSSDHWNQPLDDPDANEFVDELVLPNQAAVFNSCCRVYAPRYRQATLYAFMDDEAHGDRALDFAFADVRTAFDYFVENFNDGRPFIIAGHSQGAYHTDRLLRDIQDEAAYERMVVAYPVGYYFDPDNGVPICEDATQIGCQVGWNAVPPDGSKFSERDTDLCVNPLTWRADEGRADFAENMGAVSIQAGGQVEGGATDAQCVDGMLVVSEVRSDNFGMKFGGTYHLYDYSFFHMNIRANALARVGAYFDAALPRN